MKLIYACYYTESDSWLINFNAIANVFVGGFDFGNAQNFMVAAVASTVKWLLLYYLWRQKVFLKI